MISATAFLDFLIAGLFAMTLVKGRRMSFVDNCPKNPAEIEIASKRLKCMNDIYGNNQYICVPNFDKTSLVEFCFDGVMGIHKKNHCVETDGQSLIEFNCLNFSSGCPQELHWSYEFYKHPACQNINTEHHCYASDPSCPYQVLEKDTGYRDTITPTWGIVAVIVVGVLTLVFVCFLLFQKVHKKLPREPVNESQRDNKKNPGMVSDFIKSITSKTSIESYLKYKKDKGHSDHGCETYMIHEDA